jgi:hypothetical protein
VDLLVSISILASRSRPASTLPYLLAVFPVIHFAYGWGYLAGMFRFLLFRNVIHHSKVDISR